MSAQSNEPSYELGRVTWHCSEEGGSPDVGLSIGLGGDRLLWVGEITREAHAEGGEDAAALGDDSGWWLLIYPDRMPLAKFVNAEAARDFMDAMETAIASRKDA